MWITLYLPSLIFLWFSLHIAWMIFTYKRRREKEKEEIDYKAFLFDKLWNFWFCVCASCFLTSLKRWLSEERRTAPMTTTRAMWCLKILRTKMNGLEILIILSMTQKKNNNFMIYVFLWNICKIPFDMATHVHCQTIIQILFDMRPRFVWIHTQYPVPVMFFIFIFPKNPKLEMTTGFLYLPIFFVFFFLVRHISVKCTHTPHPKWNRNLLLFLIFSWHCFSVNGVYALCNVRFIIYFFLVFVFPFFLWSYLCLNSQHPQASANTIFEIRVHNTVPHTTWFLVLF